MGVFISGFRETTGGAAPIGAGPLQTSTLRRRINQRDSASAANELRRWVYGGGKVLPANQSQIAEFALQQFARVYAIKREVKELATDQRQAIRQQQTKTLLDALHQWMLLQRQKVPEGSARAKALDYSLRRWEALTRFAGDGQLPVDNNWLENQIRPIAIGRNNWLFAGSLRAGQRAAAVMSLIQSARMNRHDPWAYLNDVLRPLPTQPNSRIAELLPHTWVTDQLPAWISLSCA